MNKISYQTIKENGIDSFKQNDIEKLCPFYFQKDGEHYLIMPIDDDHEARVASISEIDNFFKFIRSGGVVIPRMLYMDIEPLYLPKGNRWFINDVHPSVLHNIVNEFNVDWGKLVKEALRLRKKYSQKTR